MFKLLVKAPKAFWTVGLVQFFCWAAFMLSLIHISAPENPADANDNNHS